MDKMARSVLIALTFCLSLIVILIIVSMLPAISYRIAKQPAANTTSTAEFKSISVQSTSNSISEISTPAPNVAPVLPVFNLLESTYRAAQDESEYHISKLPYSKYDDSLAMELQYDEVPESNGTAEVCCNYGSDSATINFYYGTFMGQKLCAPALIKDVVSNAVSALSGDEFVKAVVMSYDSSKFTKVVYGGDYAFVFEPSESYAASFHAISLNEYRSKFKKSKYLLASHDDFATQLNSGGLYYLKGKVTKCEDSGYRNSYFRYNCKMITIQCGDGQDYSIAQFLNDVPINIEENSNYNFYGSLMFDINNDPILHLDYVEQE